MWTSIVTRRLEHALWAMLLLFAWGCHAGWCSASADSASADDDDDSTPMLAESPGNVVTTHPTSPLVIEESDIVRLDGTRLYVMNQARGLSVIDASKPSEPELVTRLGVLAGKGGELYVRGDHLLALVEDSGLPCHRLAPAEYQRFASTAVAVVQNPTVQPQAVIDRCVPGRLVTSRLVGDMLYVVTDGGSVDPDRAWLFSLDASNPLEIRVVESLELVGRDHQVHVTDSALFVTEYDGASTRVRTVDISSQDGSLVERGSVLVPGLVPSRFHLDASAGTLRMVTRDLSSRVILTLVDVAHPDQPQVLSSIQDLAPGEVLFATRFIGDRAYVVTYRPELVVNRVTRWEGRDPLWVVSLQDPRAPRILGRLEIPGYSDYIFPRGDLLLAVGRGEDGDRVAASLFDVHDPTRPAELSRVEFGADRASSEAATDFRAVQVIEEELGTPPLVLVPYSNNYGVGAACVPEHHLQLIELGNGGLRLCGNLVLGGRVLRGLAVAGALYGVTSQVVASVDASNRDAPRIDRTITVGDPELREACVLAPETPIQEVTVSVPDEAAWSDGEAVSSDGEVCGCSTSGRCPPASHAGVGGALWVLGVLFARRRARGLRPQPEEATS